MLWWSCFERSRKPIKSPMANCKLYWAKAPPGSSPFFKKYLADTRKGVDSHHGDHRYYVGVGTHTLTLSFEGLVPAAFDPVPITVLNFDPVPIKMLIRLTFDMLAL